MIFKIYKLNTADPRQRSSKIRENFVSDPHLNML